MKKTVIAGILGLAAGMVASYGQGYISLDNYAAFQSGLGLITYGQGADGAVGSGIIDGYTVGIFFAAGNAVSDTASGNDIPLNLFAATGDGSTVSFYGSDAPGLFIASSYFQASPSSTSVPITLEVVAYNGTDYESSTIRGHSAAFTMNTAVGTSFVSSVGDFMNTFSVTPVPEPSTLALAGLSGIGMLVAFRRKKA